MLNVVIETVLKKLSVCMHSKVGVVATNRLGGGCINNALKLETNCGAFFLKWNENGKADMFLREAEGLNELAKAANGVLKIPKVFCSKEIDSTPGFVVLEYLAPQNAKDGDDEELGRGLAVIHKYTSDSFGFLSNNYCGSTQQNNTLTTNWSDFYVENRLRFLLELIQAKKPFLLSELKIFDRLLIRIPALISNNSIPVLIHGDLWSGNYMFTKYGPALIDPAVCYAEREMEFALITMFGGFSSTFFDAYSEVNPLALDWQERNRLYQLYHLLNHYYLFGGEYGNQAVSIARQFV